MSPKLYKLGDALTDVRHSDIQELVNPDITGSRGRHTCSAQDSD